MLTGEGSFDASSTLGKGPVGVGDLARPTGVPVVVLAGRVEHRSDPSVSGSTRRSAPVRRGADGRRARPETASACLQTAAGEVVRPVRNLTVPVAP